MCRSSRLVSGRVLKIFSVIGFVGGLLIAGCASSTPKIAVSLSPSSAQTLDQGQSVQITATVAND